MAQFAGVGGPGFVPRPAEQFNCSVCADLMVDPTSINCGHSFCRHCLACWYLECNKAECPLCRQVWAGHPQINIDLRRVIEERYPSDIRVRRGMVAFNGQAAADIAEFDGRMRANLTNERMRGDPVPNNNLFYGGIFCTICALIVLWLLWCMIQWVFGLAAVDTLLVNKPMAVWSPDDVTHWVRDLGPWAHENILPYFQNQPMNGHVLMEMTYEDLVAALPEVQPLFIRSFLKAVNESVERGPQAPTDLWSFKDLYLGATLAVLAMYPHTPRFTIICMYLLQYRTTFLPFVNVIFGVSDGDQVNDGNMNSSVKMRPVQWADFWIDWLLCPYVLAIRFIWNSGLLSVNWFTASLYVISFAMTTTADIIYCVSLCYNVAKNVRRVWMLPVRWPVVLGIAIGCVLLCAKVAFSAVIGWLVWNILPAFLCNLLFLLGLYCWPLAVIPKNCAQLWTYWTHIRNIISERRNRLPY